jgi:adenosylcobinamide kinase/adenosylcobinamide-phosphate guanylyltransferase
VPYTYITGGASSGKSDFALELYKDRSDVTFIATGIASDPEMAKKILSHKMQRPSCWDTIEEPVDLIGAVRRVKKEHGAVILDCLTFWVSNLIHHNKLKSDQIFKLAEETSTFLNSSDLNALVVTNELGMGIIPGSADLRLYRNIAGKVNRIYADRSESAYFVVSGIGHKIK